MSNIWTNISEYTAYELGYPSCGAFPKILRPQPEQDLVVDGVTLHGVTEFDVGPMDPKNCL